MLDKNMFLNMIEALCANFSIDKTLEDLKAYGAIVHPLLVEENVTTEEFITACNMFMKKTKGNNFKCLPGAGDFLAAIGKTPKTVEQIAKEQALIVFDGTYLYDNCVMFEDPVTNYVIESEFAGLSGLRHKYISNIGEKRPRAEGKRVFERAYITAHDSKKTKKTPLIADGHNLKNEIVMIGNPEKITMMLENHKPQVNTTTVLIENLSKKMKG